MSFQPTSGKGLCQRSGTGAPWPGHGLWQRLGWGDMAGRDKPWPCKMMSNPGESPLLLACRFCCPPIGCFALCTSLHHYWLVVSNMFYFPSHIWDNPSHWHIFFQIVIAPPTRLFWWTLGGQQLVLVSGIQWWNHHWWPVKNAASPAKECSVFGFPEYQDGPLEGDIINIYIYIHMVSIPVCIQP